MPSGPKNALAIWGTSALRPVLLPSGMKALIRLPDPGELIRGDHFPDDLRKMAAKYAVGGIEISNLDVKEVRTFLDLLYVLISKSVRYLATPESEAWDLFRKSGGDPSAEGWEPVSLTPEFFKGEGEVDNADIEALSAIVGRQMTPNEVTIASKLDQESARTPEDLDPDEGGRVSDHAGFRGEPGGDLDRADGEDVRAATVVSPRRSRPRRSSRA